MKSKKIIIAIVATLCFIFCGCNKERNSVELSTDSTLNELFIPYDTEWFDNSLDAYSATSKPVLLMCENPLDAVEGGVSMSTLNAFGAATFKKHLYREPSKCWDEVVFADETGQKQSVCIATGLERQVFAIGSFSTQNHYLLFLTEKDESNPNGFRYLFSELDEQMCEIKTIPVTFLNKENNIFPRSMLVDNQSNIHMITENFSTGEIKYHIVSAEGTELQKLILDTKEKSTLVLLQDGSVALRRKEEVCVVDSDNGEKKIIKELSFPCDSCTTFQEGKVIWANNRGIYERESLSGQDVCLYKWSNHGISVSEVVAIQGLNNGKMNVLYMNSKGYQFLQLEPTTQNIEIRKITFGISSFDREMYSGIVAEFNRQFPAYHIELRSYEYGDTKLTSEMISGEGPVILAGDLMDFENQVKYWEPLDKVFSQMNVDGDLIPEVVDLGRINGTLYGIVPNFVIRTVLTGREELYNWNYKSFLQCIQEDECLEGIFNGHSLDEGEAFVTLFFIHGMEDCFFFDATSKSTSFDAADFRTILQLGKQYQGMRCEFDKLKDGTLLCLTAEIAKPVQIAYIRVLLGDDANYIGYPSKNGSSHYLYASSPLVVRESATEEEKRVAHTFLKMLLSYDMQLELTSNSGMSIRRDVLDKQIQGTSIYSSHNLYGLPITELKETEIDYEKDANTLYRLIKEAKPYRYIPRELSRVILEEIEPYFSGDVNEDTVIRNLKSRVELYLQEQ